MWNKDTQFGNLAATVLNPVSSSFTEQELQHQGKVGNIPVVGECGSSHQQVLQLL